MTHWQFKYSQLKQNVTDGSTAGKVQLTVPTVTLQQVYLYKEAKYKYIRDFKEPLDWYHPVYYIFIIMTSRVIVNFYLQMCYWTNSYVLHLARQSLKIICSGTLPLGSQLNSSIGCTEYSQFSITCHTSASQELTLLRSTTISRLVLTSTLSTSPFETELHSLPLYKLTFLFYSNLSFQAEDP